jgi:hypothetical protein
LEAEAKDLRKLIDELEFQKKRLNDRIYEQLNEKALTYKERTIQALQASTKPIATGESLSADKVPDFVRQEGRKSISPLHNKSGGKSYAEQPLSYQYRDVLRSSGEKRSPLRSGSPLRNTHLASRDLNSGSEYNPPNDIAYNRVRMSVERISKVLGLSNPLAGPTNENAENRNPARNNSSHSGTVYAAHETPGVQRQVDLSNRVVERSPNRSPARQASPYMLLRQKSPQRKPMDNITMEAPTGTQYATVSKQLIYCTEQGEVKPSRT